MTLYSVPNDLPYKDGLEDGDEDQFQSYLNFPATLNQKYDLILDDGRARLAVRWRPQFKLSLGSRGGGCKKKSEKNFYE